MEKILNVIGNTGTACGTCAPKGCGSCGPTPRKNETPVALSRREFGHAVLAASASALLTGCSSQKNAEPGDGSAPARFRASRPFARSRRGPDVEGSDHDGARRVLQDGSWTLQFPHHGADENYIRFLPAGFEASGGSTPARHSAQGSFIWQPECDGQRSRHG